MNTTGKRIGHVVIAGLTFGMVAGLLTPRGGSVSADDAPPITEPVEPAPSTTAASGSSPATTGTDTTIVAGPAGQTPPPTTAAPATAAPATAAPTTAAPATAAPATVPAAPVQQAAVATTEPPGTLATTLPPPVAPTAAPSAPVWVSATPGDTTATLQWSPPASDGGVPITDYVVERRLADASDWTVVADGVGAGTSATVTGLTNGTTYSFRVHAVNLDGPGATSDEMAVTPRTVPAAPQSLAAAPTNGSGQIRLTWTAPSDGGAPISDYVIERSLDGTAGWLVVGDGVSATTSFVVTALANGARYHFRVTARNDAGTGAASSVASAIPRTVPSATRSLAAAPTNLSGQIRLTWTAPASTGGSAITDYVIQRSPNGTTEWVTVTDGVNLNTAYTVTGLANGTRYYFRVLARNAAGLGAPSNNANAIPRTVPTAPRSLTAAATGASGQIRLAWLAPASNGGTAITDYVVQRSPNGTSGWVTIADGVNTTPAYTVTGLTNGVRYHFRVYARNVVGYSPPSNLANAIPRFVLTAPRVLTATPTNLSGQVRLAWTAPLSNGGRPITDYVIQRSPNGTTGWVTIADGVSTATAYTAAGLTNGVRYYFRVYARTGTVTGPASNTANAIPRIKPTAPRTPTAAPNNVSGQIRLTWVAPASNGGSAITDYIVQRSPDGTVWTTLVDGINTATAYTATGLTNGTRYHFRILARNAAGISAASPTVNAVPRTVPSQPSFVFVDADADGFLIEWSPPASTGGSPITGYLIEEFIPDTATWVTLGTFPESWRLVFIDAPGEGCGTFRIAAVNVVGQSAFLGPVEDCWP